MQDKKTQREAVVNAVKIVMGSKFKLNSTIVKDNIMPEQLRRVCALVSKAILSGQVEYGASIEEKATVIRYVNGMVINQLRKTPELNGGINFNKKR